MPRLRRRLSPLVLATIRISDQLTWIQIVETGEVDRDVVASDYLEMSSLERTHTAVLTGARDVP
jgi:hypothetical protein